MRMSLIGRLVAMMVLCSVVSATRGSEAMERDVAHYGEDVFTSRDFRKGELRHLVLFRYKDSVTAEQRGTIKRHFLELAEVCERNGTRYVKSIETGVQNSGEGADQDFEQGFMLTFKSEGDRNYFVGRSIVQNNFDKNHDEFKSFVAPFLREPVIPEGLFVFDFNVEPNEQTA